MSDELLPEFLAEAAAGAPSDEPALQELLQAGRAAWPALDVPASAFARRLGAAWSARKTPPRELHGSDLYLACACARGHPVALAEVDRLIRDACASIPGAAASDSDEVAQRLRQRLLLSSGDDPPDISLYSGHGPLRSWLKVVAVREAWRRRVPAGSGSRAGPEGLEQIAFAGPDPELDYLRLRHRDDFRTAFADALADLSARERNVLRLYYLDGLGVARIGDLHQVHASTVSRWLLGAREALLARTRGLLEERLRLTSAEVDSLLGALRSQMGASLERLLPR